MTRAPKRTVVDDGLLGEVIGTTLVGVVLVHVGRSQLVHAAEVSLDCCVMVGHAARCVSTEPSLALCQVLLAALADYADFIYTLAAARSGEVGTEHLVGVLLCLLSPIGLVGASVVGKHRVTLVTVAIHVLLQLHGRHSHSIGEVERVEVTTGTLAQFLLDRVELLKVPLGRAPLGSGANHCGVCATIGFSTPQTIQSLG